MVYDYDPKLQSLAKRIRGVQYSGTLRCWYLDESEENLSKIIQAFRDHAEIDLSCVSSDSTASSTPPGSPGNIDPGSNDEFIQEDDVVTVLPAESRSARVNSRYDPVEFRINEQNGRLVIKFTGKYSQEWIQELKTYGRLYYDKTHREFMLQWSKMTVDSLSDYFARQSVPVRVIRPRVDEAVIEKRKNFGEEVRSRELGIVGCEAIETLRMHLEQNRYSDRTIDSYLTLIELFFKFFHDKDPDDITQNDVATFINDFIINNGFSTSYQNQMVSAIKMYYEVTGRGKVIPMLLERPRRSRALPKVFSKEEVSRILTSGRNSKHKLMLCIIYSCGLRRSEVTNIRLADIDRERNVIHIREGKGRVDRIVPLPEKILPRLDDYLVAYRPGTYLFEGQNGGRYSVESVYNVFKQALKRAGIRKEVGVHCLRHSYATHLHENGLDIRYIQELLGHKSTRTTEIYTHVSRRNLISVRSPIEDMDVR